MTDQEEVSIVARDAIAHDATREGVTVSKEHVMGPVRLALGRGRSERGDA